MSKEFKENSSSKPQYGSVKRYKMDENIKKNESLDESSSASVTIYEDDSDISYFNRSTKNRLMNSSLGRRSPLALLNKAGSSAQLHQLLPPPPDKSTYSKTPSKFDDSYLKRLQPKEHTIDPFQHLSDEIILQIFQYLPKKTLMRIALVNERFSRIVHDDSLWIRMDLGHKALRRGAIGKIFSKGLIILRLAQAKIQSPIFESHFELEGFQTKLQYLDLSLASIDKTSLAQLISTCRLLKKLSIEHVPVDDDVCRAIGQNKSLEALNMAMCDGINPTGTAAMMTNLQCLLAFNASWASLSSDCIGAIVSRIAPSIMRLNIAGCRKSLVDQNLQTLVQRCPNIVELDVSDCTKLSAETITIVSQLKNLEYLSLSRCYNITMTSYLMLATIKSMLYLDVFGLLSNEGLQMLEKTFKNVGINKFVHSSVARPTVTPRRTSVWGLRTRD